jgi:hypothetical protein
MASDEMRDELSGEEAGRPRPKPGRGPLVAMLCLGVLLVGGMVFALVYFLSGAGRVDEEMLAYLPPNSNIIMCADIDDILKNEEVKKILSKPLGKMPKGPLSELNERIKPADLTVDDFSRVVMGGVMDKDEPTFVLRVKKSFDKAKLAAAFEFKKEQRKGDVTYYTNDRGKQLAYFPSDTLIVVTTAQQFEALAAKGAAQVTVSAEMQDLAKKMSKGQFWMVYERSVFPANFNQEIDKVAKKEKAPYTEILEALKDMKGGGVRLKFDGDHGDFASGILCGRQETAEKAEAAFKKAIEDQRDKGLENDPSFGEQLKQMPGLKTIANELLKSLAVDRSGPLVEVSGSIKINAIATNLDLAVAYLSQKFKHAGKMPVPNEEDLFLPRPNAPRDTKTGQKVETLSQPKSTEIPPGSK